MSNRLTNFIASGLLALMGITAFFSMKDIATTMDELPHISAGYSYLSQKDYRLNPEHPPLIKDLAALPLMYQNLNFPEDHPSWKEGVNRQWWFGNQFLYQSGNDVDRIVFSARIPMLLLLLALGALIFHWTRKLGGNLTALFALFLFALSPTFLAHGRLVTTDVGAAFGFVLAIFFYLKFLKNSSKLNIILAGVTLGIALLSKFSCILLLPLFAVVTLVYVILFKRQERQRQVLKSILKSAFLALLVLIIAALVIYAFYLFHIWNYPQVKQIEDTKYLLASSPSPLFEINAWLAQSKVFRPLGQYLLGLSMATQRVAGGNTVYFLGDVSNTAWWYYFPVVYFLKVPLAFHILTLLAILLAFLSFSRLTTWLKKHFSEFSMLLFLVIYWFTSITGNLNIGMRHILPVLPFTYILVSLGIKRGYWKLKSVPLRKVVILGLFILIFWYGFSSLRTFPHYLSYFNEIGGGSENGYKYVVDSNYDWGQDLKRLKAWVENPPAGVKIEKIYVDYFGGGDVPYYLKEKYLPWQGTNLPDEFPKGNYLAVSATLLQGGRAVPTKGFSEPTDYYNWLNSYTPVARAGNSIFIYYID